MRETRPAQLRGYFTTVFAARLTDHVDETISGAKLKIRFLRVYQRVHEPGSDMALSVGRHTNDKELSYYARTPSGFEWEVGWNPVVIDENTWQPSTHQGVSIWGHTPVGQTIIDKLDQFRIGVRSLARREDPVPALSGAGIPDD